MRILSLHFSSFSTILLLCLSASNAQRWAGPKTSATRPLHTVSSASRSAFATSSRSNSMVSSFLLFPSLTDEDIELHEARIAMPTQQTDNQRINANTENFGSDQSTAQGDSQGSSNNLAIIVGASSAGFVALVALGFLVHRSQAENITVKQFVSRLGTALPGKREPSAAPTPVLVESDSIEEYQKTMMSPNESLAIAMEKNPFEEWEKKYAGLRQHFFDVTVSSEIDSESSVESSVSSSSSNNDNSNRINIDLRDKHTTWYGSFDSEGSKDPLSRAKSLPTNFDDTTSSAHLSNFQIQKVDSDRKPSQNIEEAAQGSLHNIAENDTMSIGSRSSWINYPLRKLLRFPRHLSSSTVLLPSTSQITVVSTLSPALLRPARPVTPFDLPPDTFIPMQNCPFRLVSREEILQDPIRRLGQDS